MLERLHKRTKFCIAICVDATVAATTLWISYWFLAQVFNTGAAERFWWLLPVSSVITVCLFYFFGLYRAVLRFAGARFFVQVIVSSLIVSGLVASIALASVYGERVGFPRRVFVLFALMLSVGSASTRLFVRWCFERRANRNRIPAVIYGAGSGGSQLFAATRYGGQYSAKAFIDDDSEQQGKTIHGLRVFSRDKIKTLIESKKIQVVLLAMPSIDQNNRSEIINYLQQFNVVIKTTPSLIELVSGKASVSDLHNLSFEDLMSRPTMRANEDLARYCVTEKSVMVTGAGGSIGSELCRQIIARKPCEIVLFEISESALFYIEQELLSRKSQLGSKVNIISILGSVLDKKRLEEVIREYSVTSVFHAAAYKHVPMVEANPIEGMNNNVIGTRRVAEVCADTGVKSFVMVSTDKAVRPTNLMGASKRVAELVAQSIAINNSGLNTCIVRFGNVLGSSGSVVPTFREQIKCGGPVTITHPDMTRFFMSIPEASQLVMQAGAMAKNAEIFVLDMGSPVRIVDLAKRMIEFAGLSVCDTEHPNGDIEIKFTGLRPGEKMYEELSISGALSPTEHSKIRESQEEKPASTTTLLLIDKMEVAIELRDIKKMLDALFQLVPEYNPSDLYANSKTGEVLIHTNESILEGMQTLPATE
ncbi:MAG: nucleoside-diphosphate sugar epimerase/dehydratase [Planctomycetota bacterium]|nr:nucleoside-diphosphate sugar epimerase/dehydratase [Planctomycetota bacterium]